MKKFVLEKADARQFVASDFKHRVEFFCRRAMLLTVVCLCIVVSANANQQDDAYKLSDFYAFYLNSNGYNVVLKSSFKNQLNKGTGGSFTSGDYTWTTGTPLPNPAPDGMYNGKPVTDMSEMFDGCSSLKSLDLSNFYTGNVTNMSEMFSGCSNLTSLDLSNFNTGNVTNMSEMFSGCSNLTSLDLSSFNTTNVTDMSSMFIVCKSLTGLDLNNFNTTNVTNMRAMFDGCSLLKSLDLSSFNTGKVTDMVLMFFYCLSLESLDLSSFNTANVTDMFLMFYNCSSLTSLDLSSFNTANATSMASMFVGCSSLTSLDLSSFNTANVTSMSSMFVGCSSLTNLDLTNFNTDNVTNMSSMFNSCPLLTNLNLNSFNIKNVTAMNDMFNNCGITTNNKPAVGYAKDIATASFFNDLATTSIDTARLRFKIIEYSSYTLSTQVNDITMGSVTGGGSYSMGTIATLVATAKDGYRFVGWNNGATTNPYIITVARDMDLTANFDTIKKEGEITLVDFYTYTLADNGNGYKVRLTAAFKTELNKASGGEFVSNGYTWHTNDPLPNPTRDSLYNERPIVSMKGIFEECSKLTYLDLSNFSTENITDMSSMFFRCPSLTSLDLSSFNTSNVADMNRMFTFCSSLASLDLSNFNTGNVTDMSYMFSSCSSLTTLDLSNFNIGNVTTMTDMFGSCGKRVNGVPAIGIANDSATVFIFNDKSKTGIYTANLSFVVDDTPKYTVTATAHDSIMGLVTGSGTYKQGRMATLTAVPNYGCLFKEWSDGETVNPRTITVNEDINITAIFEAVELIVTVSTNDATMGSVTGSGTYQQGEAATLTATANDGFKFKEWSDGETANPRTITVDENVILIANFERITSVGAYGVATTLQIHGNMLLNHTATEVIIYDNSGRKVIVSKDVNIDLSPLVRGVYVAATKTESLKIVRRN